MINKDSIENIGEVLDVLEEMKGAGIIENYAIGGAFAAILHYEPISTIDLDIFFFLGEKNDSPILSLNALYDFAKEKGFSFDHEFINIYGWLVQFVEATHSPLWTEAIENADTIKIVDSNAKVIDKEHLRGQSERLSKNCNVSRSRIFGRSEIVRHFEAARSDGEME